MLAEIWRSTAVVMIILVAGTQLIPKEYNEAALVMGRQCLAEIRQGDPALAEAELADGADLAHYSGAGGVRGGDSFGWQ